MTPDQFQTAALAWITAVLTVAVPATAAYLVILGKLKDAKEATLALHAQNSARLDKHDAAAGIDTTPVK